MVKTLHLIGYLLSPAVRPVFCCPNYVVRAFVLIQLRINMTNLDQFDIRLGQLWVLNLAAEEMH